jgi:hypothetical protein
VGKKLRDNLKIHAELSNIDPISIKERKNNNLFAVVEEFLRTIKVTSKYAFRAKAISVVTKRNIIFPKIDSNK